MNINGLGNTYNSINTNSKQYKALKEKGWLSGVIENESMMSPEEKMIYEIFGGRDTIIKNLMKQFDSDGDLLNSNGVAGMDVTGKGTSWQKLTNVSEEHRQKMFDNVKWEFIQEKGLSNGDTTKRSDIFKDYQLSVSKDKRLSGTWTLEQYEGQYRAAMYAAVKSANPNWKPGQAFDASILDNVTRELCVDSFAASYFLIIFVNKIYAIAGSFFTIFSISDMLFSVTSAIYSNV
ncbi:DUF3879 family protein [Roseburia intestinalis]|uniref:DUF3879 family protein n=1 Tax=Roseburia intestinalis TaxID=166486 RepID=UPI001AD82B8E